MDEQTLVATPRMWGLIIASVLVLAVSVVSLSAKRKRTGRFSWSGLTLVMFLSVLLYDAGIWHMTGDADSFLLAVFRSIQVISANRDFEFPQMVGASDAQVRLLMAYGALLFIVAPVSVVAAVLEHFSDALASIRLLLTSLFADSFVFSRLDERTLDLAQDVRAHYHGDPGTPRRGPCIAFASCSESSDELLESVRKLGAI